MKITADDKIPFLRGIPEKFAEIKYVPASGFTHEAIRESDVLFIRTPNKCTRKKLAGTKVKFIASTTIGFDHIDIDYCREAGIEWMNCPGCNAVSVSQYIISCLLELAEAKHFDLRTKTVGIVGVGNVGKEIEKVCLAFGIPCLKCDPPRTEIEGEKNFVDLSTIAAQCDIITFHVPLTTTGEFPTYHLADKNFFSMLRKKPCFINAARGAVHDTDALIQAKKQGFIDELIIDCWENEPLISRELLEIAFIATPHIAGFSADGKANGTRMCLAAFSEKYSIPIPGLQELTCPLPPDYPVIDLDKFPEKRVEKAILQTFSPWEEDKRLRESPGDFEYLRTHYNNPREFAAYKINHATREERIILEKLGFQVEEFK